ncbi:MAG TPA: immunoglobulin-like domain-containing protein [Chitinophagaceae bacterium]|nr:immunoglobulin-like domain-containing protein [Chitinophagaceae bacterium]
MKRLQYFLFLSLLVIGCAKEENVKITDSEVGHSRIVFFPSIAIKGEHLIILQQGSTFTDPGAAATLNAAAAQFSVAGTVTTATPGVYNLVYEAKNAEGYSATDFRTVVVIGNDVAAKDLSGKYLREATGVTSTWTKTGPGVYSIENPGGAAVGVGLKAIAVNYTGNKIAIPKQISPDLGQISTSTESYDPATGTIKYALAAGGYGAALRTFVKQ